MGTVPDIETVRDYVKVPATALSDADLERMRAACLNDQAARCVWPGLTNGGVFLAVSDMTATVAIYGGTPFRVYSVSWGAAERPEDVTADDNGDATDSHVFTDPGDYPLWVTDGAKGDTLGAALVTVPGESVAADVSYPDALAQALLRRIQREIAARNLPLGMVGLEHEYGPANIPAYDALVEHHEMAYRRQVLA